MRNGAPSSPLAAAAAALIAMVSFAGCERLFGDGGKDALSDLEPSSSAPQDDEQAGTPDKSNPKKKPQEQSPSGVDPDDGGQEPQDIEGPSDPAEQRPVDLSEVGVTHAGGMLGAGTLEVTAQGKLNQKIESGTYVQTKVVCKHERRLLADTALLDSVDYTKPVQNLEIGDTAELRGRVFTQGIEEPPESCQLEFRLAGAGGGVSLPLGFACYQAESTKLGPCSPPIVAAAMSGPGRPLEVGELEVSNTPGFGGRGGLNVSYVLDIRRAQDANNRISLKVACPIENTTFVEVNGTHLQAGPFKFEPGESVARASSFFYNPALGLTEPPPLCDLTFSLWEPRRGSFAEATHTKLHNACWRDGRVESGRCERDEPEPPPPAPATENSLSLDDVQLEVVEPYGGKGDRFQLKLQADATVEHPVDQFASVSAVVTCKVGKTARVETAYLYGVELYYLRPGETTRMTSTAFGSHAMDRKPGSCEAEFMVGRRFSASGRDALPLGKWCLRRGRVNRC